MRAIRPPSGEEKRKEVEEGRERKEGKGRKGREVVLLSLSHPSLAGRSRVGYAIPYLDGSSQ